PREGAKIEQSRGSCNLDPLSSSLVLRFGRGGVMAALAGVGLSFLLAYLVGGVRFGYLVARWRGVDILHQGSGNIGATNVGRVLGRRFGILVFLLDSAKGAGPVLFLGAPTTDTG